MPGSRRNGTVGELPRPPKSHGLNDLHEQLSTETDICGIQFNSLLRISRPHRLDRLGLILPYPLIPLVELNYMIMILRLFMISIQDGLCDSRHNCRFLNSFAIWSAVYCFSEGLPGISSISGDIIISVPFRIETVRLDCFTLPCFMKARSNEDISR
jgi:hypothetical protein